MKENEFIKIIQNTLTSPEYIGDDTAYIESRDLIVTQDTLVEDVHFRTSTISPYNLGRKSVAVNLSDIAASGGVPEFILVSLSLPKSVDESFIKDFYRGINQICDPLGVKTIGGDITGAQKICISVTAIGKSGGLLPANRRNAQPDDVVVVTGDHGSSSAGLWLLENSSNFDNAIKEEFINSHLSPIPQVVIGREIVRACQPRAAMMDSSDGLADALYKLASMSGVDIETDADSIPRNQGLEQVSKAAGVDALSWILFGGEDYQLVATMSQVKFDMLANKGIKLFPIGRVLKAEGVPRVIVKSEGKTFEITQSSLDNYGFNHFGDGS